MQVCQLSDDPADGTPEQQIAQIGNSGFAGWTCVSENYTGVFPETDSSLWYWDGEKVVSKELIPPIPTLTPRQVRFVLNAAGLRETVEAMVAQADQYTKDWWEFSEEYKHDHPVLVQMAGQLGLTPEQVEQMFRDGALI